jgi:DNA-binding MarR family transcriptional regulator/N-acetylglutamate synthase-like GNAT family acetyltransferase
MRAESCAEIEAVRRFNRFYTQKIGVLEEGLLASSFTLAQARVLFELGSREPVTAGELARDLGLDAGYLSRILQGFATSRLLLRERSDDDARRSALSLTARGRKAFRAIDQRSRSTIGRMIMPLAPCARERLLEAMHTVERTLSERQACGDRPIVVRPYGIGDVGWAIERHARLYAEEYGWNAEFEALVATLFARFASQHDARSEQFWIAEIGGERVGCVFVVRNETDPRAAQLRCLLVDPKGRGRGVGRRLVEECLAFAKSAGYLRVVLWTNDNLHAARRIYESAGFGLIEAQPHHSFGQDLVGQTWARAL